MKQCLGSVISLYGVRLRIRILLFCLFLIVHCTVGALTSVSKDSMSLRSHKSVKIMVYQIFLLVVGIMEGYRYGTDPDPRPQKRTNPDPDD